jgi:hypothetical protein
MVNSSDLYNPNSFNQLIKCILEYYATINVGEDSNSLFNSMENISELINDKEIQEELGSLNMGNLSVKIPKEIHKGIENAFKVQLSKYCF